MDEFTYISKVIPAFQSMQLSLVLPVLDQVEAGREQQRCLNWEAVLGWEAAHH